ncbi:hypothetical protein N7507_010333 [Penicillium longicatenatum]|nr:hypothetical protein N7507_010333 [Penicillium longicatenatum]
MNLYNVRSSLHSPLGLAAMVTDGLSASVTAHLLRATLRGFPQILRNMRWVTGVVIIVAKHKPYGLSNGHKHNDQQILGYSVWARLGSCAESNTIMPGPLAIIPSKVGWVSILVATRERVTPGSEHC